MTAFCIVAAWRKPDGVVGACASVQAAVDTIASTSPERFSAASKAVTPTVMVLPQVKPPNVYVVSLTLSLRCVFV
jgi:hypothetical protein